MYVGRLQSGRANRASAACCTSGSYREGNTEDPLARSATHLLLVGAVAADR